MAEGSPSDVVHPFCSISRSLSSPASLLTFVYLHHSYIPLILYPCDNTSIHLHVSDAGLPELLILFFFFLPCHVEVLPEVEMSEYEADTEPDTVEPTPDFDRFQRWLRAIQAHTSSQQIGTGSQGSSPPTCRLPLTPPLAPLEAVVNNAKEEPWSSPIQQPPRGFSDFDDMIADEPMDPIDFYIQRISIFH